MKRVFIVGDHKTGTGPANVTKQYIKHFPKGTLYQRAVSKAFRLPELIVKILLCDVVLFSGYSYQNVIGMKLAKRTGKKTAYVVHGAITHENKINHAEDKHMSEVEEETFLLADRLYGVSRRFSEWLKNEYPQYADKISYIINGVDNVDVNSVGDAGGDVGSLHNSTLHHNNDNSEKHHDIHSILSIGGGMPRKRILNICKAVELLNKDNLQKYTLYVIGKDGYDTEAIRKYDFVKDLGLVDADTKYKLFKECGLFIQNSCFETFGLAPVEALMSGMSILVSGVCGVLDVIENAEDSDIINDCENIEEIAEKIRLVTERPNNERLFRAIDLDKTSWKTRCRQLYEQLQDL